MRQLGKTRLLQLSFDRAAAHEHSSHFQFNFEATLTDKSSLKCEEKLPIEKNVRPEGDSDLEFNQSTN